MTEGPRPSADEVLKPFSLSDVMKRDFPDTFQEGDGSQENPYLPGFASSGHDLVWQLFRAGEEAYGKIYFSFNGNVFSFHSEVEEKMRYAVHKALEDEKKIQNAEEMCLYFNHVDRFLRSRAGRKLQASLK